MKEYCSFKCGHVGEVGHLEPFRYHNHMVDAARAVSGSHGFIQPTLDDCLACRWTVINTAICLSPRESYVFLLEREIEEPAATPSAETPDVGAKTMDAATLREVARLLRGDAAAAPRGDFFRSGRLKGVSTYNAFCQFADMIEALVPVYARDARHHTTAGLLDEHDI